MKDQNPISDGETKTEKMNRAYDLYIESIHKPDNALRACAHNQKCFNELMEVREQVLNYAYTLRQTDYNPSTTQVYYEMEHDSEGC